jgi:hypothetical protein
MSGFDRGTGGPGTMINRELIIKALHYYGKNHSRERAQVKKELENWRDVK